MPNFAMFRAIWTRFKPNSSENARQSFTFHDFSRNWNLIIDLDAHLINKHALQLLWCSELFSPPLTPTFVKPHNRVSRFTNFSELKFDHFYWCAFGWWVCTATFRMFIVIFSSFKPNLNKYVRSSFTFDVFIKIETWL